MNILIIGCVRTGTTSLLEGIVNQNYHRISEPFNRLYRDELLYPIDFSLHENNCVKTITYQKPHEYNEYDVIYFYKKFIKNFDRIILLDRYDFEEHWISSVNLYWKGRIKAEKKLETWPMHDKWYIDDLTKDMIEECKTGWWNDFFIQQKNQINEISKEFNIDITYYEDLFGEDRNKSLEIIKGFNLELNSEKLNEYLNPRYKYFQKNPKSLL